MRPVWHPLGLTKILRSKPTDLLAARRASLFSQQVDEAVAKATPIGRIEPPAPATFEDRLVEDQPGRAGSALSRDQVAEAIQCAIAGVERSPVFTANERRAVRQAMLYVRQRLDLVEPR
jgi:hypothetical protein